MQSSRLRELIGRPAAALDRDKSGKARGGQASRCTTFPRALRHASPVAAVVLVGVAGWLLFRELRGVRYEDVRGYLAALPVGWLLAAVAGTVGAYAALTGHDVLALRYVGRHLRYRRVAGASLIGFGISNTVGQIWLSGGVARYRLYRVAGLSASEIGRLVVFVTLGFWLGYVALGGLLFAFLPTVGPEALRLPIPRAVLGVSCWALLVAYVAWCARGWGVKGFRPPALGLALGQIGLGVLRTMLTAGVLYALLATVPGTRYLDVLAAFVLGVAAGMLGQVPAAAGVLEVVVVAALSPSAPVAAVLGALVVFRLVYYLLPCALALGGLALWEARQRRAEISSEPDK